MPQVINSALRGEEEAFEEVAESKEIIEDKILKIKTFMVELTIN